MDWFIPEYVHLFKWQFTYYMTYVWIIFCLFIGPYLKRGLIVAGVSLFILPLLMMLKIHGWIVI